MVMPDPAAGERPRALPGMPAPSGAGRARALPMRAFARLITGGADKNAGHVPAPAKSHGATLYEHYIEEGQRWRMLAGAPWGLASALGEALAIDVDAAWHEELPASRRPHVVRMVRCDFATVRAEESAYGCVLLAPPANADIAAWVERAFQSLAIGGQLIMLTTARALGDAACAALGDGRWMSLNVYTVNPVAMRRDAGIARDQHDQITLIAKRTNEAERRVGIGNAEATVGALRDAAAKRASLPMLGDTGWSATQLDYPFRTFQHHGIGHTRHQIPSTQQDLPEAPLFGGPPVAAETALAAALGEGIFRQPALVNAIAAPEGVAMETLEEPREAQMAQLMAVVRTALPVQHDDGRVEFISFHTAKQVHREGERADEENVRAAQIVETESLETIVAILDLDSGEVRRIDPEELGELQRELAPQLLESTRRMIVPQVEPEDVEGIWKRRREALPPDLAEQQLGRLTWGRQTQTAAACAESLDRNGVCLIVGSPGSGKTQVLATAVSLSDARTIDVVCPPEVIPEWEEQIREILPNAIIYTPQRPAEVSALPGPMPGQRRIALHSDATLVNGRRRPAAVPRIPRSEVGVFRGVRGARKNDIDPKPDQPPDGPILPQVLSCPRCGAIQRRRPSQGSKALPFASYRGRGSGVPLRDCSSCGERLWQFEAPHKSKRAPYCRGCGWLQLSRSGEPLAERAAGRGECPACGTKRSGAGAIGWRWIDTRNWSLAETWKRNGYTPDLLIVDEAHRFKGEDTLRGIEMGRLMQLAPRVALATATLTNGTASSLYFLLCRIMPELRRRFPTVERFTQQFGVQERAFRIKEDRHGGLIRVSEQTSELPGLHPALIGELLPYSSFLVHEDVLEQPVKLTEYLEAPPLPDAEQRLIDPVNDPEQWGKWQIETFAPAMWRGMQEYVKTTVPDGTEEEQEAARGIAYDRWMEALRLARGEITLEDVPADRRIELRQVVPSGDSPRDRYVSMVRGLPEEDWLYAYNAGPQAARFAPDTWHWKGEVFHSHRGLPAVILPPAADGAESPKERRVVEICVAEAAVERRCLVYVEGTQVRDIAERLRAELAAAGLRVALMRPSTGGGPRRRKEWIHERLREGIDVLVAHPRSVGTGMNLQEFATTVAYEISPENQRLRQAMQRGLRVDQSEEVKHVYMCAGSTRQETDLVLHMSRTLAAQPMEGRIIGPERLERLVGIVGLDAQDRGLKMMDELRGKKLAPGLAEMLNQAAERVPAVAAERGYRAPSKPDGGPNGPGRRGSGAGSSGAKPIGPPVWLRELNAFTAEPLAAVAEAATDELEPVVVPLAIVTRPPAWEMANGHRPEADNAQLALFAFPSPDETSETAETDGADEQLAA